MGVWTHSATLSTTASLEVKADLRRLSLMIVNTDTAISISIGESTSAGFITLYPQQSIVFDFMHGDDPRLPYYLKSASGSPVVNIYESVFDVLGDIILYLRQMFPWVR